MAETNKSPQGGGGASEDKLTIKSLNENITLPHLLRIFETHGGPENKKEWNGKLVTSFLKETQHNEDPAVTAFLKNEIMNFDDFTTYMRSPHSSITNPSRPEDLDLSWPMACYFISSSHNTYLSGNQLSSDSTTASYTNVLNRGCRCVEVDVWDASDSDSSSDDEPEAKRKEIESGKKLGRYKSIKGKLPRSLTARLEKTTIGRKLEEREAKKEGASTATTPDASVNASANASASETPATAASVTPVTSTEKQEKSVAAAEPEAALIEPRVLHGFTLTKEITFRDVCNAIRDAAFEVTDTPVIVSLEVHCSPPQQTAMVRIMKESWAGFLVDEPELGKDPDRLPSPEELRKKILVKVKYAPPGSSPEEYESSEDDRNPPPKGAKSGSGKPSKIIQDLSRMGVYTKGVSFKSFDQPEATMPTHIFSLAESKFLDHHEKQNEKLWEHNKNFLMRAYPSGLRIRSDNLNPAPFWGSGAQVVALNWQQTDEGMMLNEGMFSGTGGYVLKPRGYRPPSKTSPTTETIQTKSLKHLRITFLAAQSIPLPPGDTNAKSFEPYVKVEIHVDALEGLRGGHIKDDGHEREGEYKAKTRTHRGCDVDLGGERLEFSNIPGLMDELTFVRFTVRDDEIGRDDLAAWACVRLDRLASGYRFIRLLDARARQTDGVILVKVEKEFM